MGHCLVAFSSRESEGREPLGKLGVLSLSNGQTRVLPSNTELRTSNSDLRIPTHPRSHRAPPRALQRWRC
jgi:hypothetical protein